MTGSSFLDAADWEFPVPIRYGPGRLAELGELCRAAGVENPLIVTDSASRDLPFIAKACRIVEAAGLRHGVFSEVAPNPTDLNIRSGRQAYVQGGHDGVIAIGGGSGMDAGKAISLIAKNDRDVWAFDFDAPSPSGMTSTDFPPLICIPTTAGTGAETESTAMVTDTARRIKGCVWHPGQKPVGVLLDPALTVGLPTTLTAWTGIDALVHAIEAYSVNSNHPMCDGIALEALRLIYRNLPKALAEPTSIEARGAMLVGSCLAGVAFLKGLGLVHAISHMVGAEFDSHHGLTNAIVLPVVLRFNQSHIEAKVGPMCQAMGLAQTGFDPFMDAINGLLDHCDIPKSLSALGVKANDAARLAEKAAGDAAAGTNPRAASVTEITALIETAITGARA